MLPPVEQIVPVTFQADIGLALRTARRVAAEVGFADQDQEEVAIVAGELASNLVKHAGGGTMIVASTSVGERCGVQIESRDQGPGLADVAHAMADGFSSSGSLGYGLGTVNRLMDEWDIAPESGEGYGTRILCRRWLRTAAEPGVSPPLEFAVASRPHPRMKVNGDTFVMRRRGPMALVGVIDGVGHGEAAHLAAAAAREYVERHDQQPLDSLFRGVACACQASRGVVMALARLDGGHDQLTFASVGNIEGRYCVDGEKISLGLRRGVLGFSAPAPLVTQHRWSPGAVLVLHSDGIVPRWQWEELSTSGESATELARRLLNGWSREDDDATALVLKGGRHAHRD